MFQKTIAAVAITFFSATVFATPCEIVIVRHGDKFAKAISGPFLSGKGQLRAEKLAVYCNNTVEKVGGE